MTTANAEEVLTWVQKNDHVAITSYIEQQWKLHRTSATKDLENKRDGVLCRMDSRLLLFPSQCVLQERTEREENP